MECTSEESDFDIIYRRDWWYVNPRKQNQKGSLSNDQSFLVKQVHHIGHFIFVDIKTLSTHNPLPITLQQSIFEYKVMYDIMFRQHINKFVLLEKTITIYAITPRSVHIPKVRTVGWKSLIEEQGVKSLKPKKGGESWRARPYLLLFHTALINFSKLLL